MLINPINRINKKLALDRVDEVDKRWAYKIGNILSK